AYHGLGSLLSRRILLLIDGRAALSSFTGNIRWLGKSISLDDIERIEVIRGANTVTYGDNAVFATINIITRHTSKDHASHSEFAAGDDDYREAQLHTGLHFDHGDLRVTVGYTKEDSELHLPDDFDKRFFNLRSDWTLTEQDSLMLQIGASETSIPIAGTARTTHSERILSANYQQLKWRHKSEDANEFQLHVYHNQDKRDVDFLKTFRISGLGRTQIPITRDHSDERYDIEVTQTSRPASGLRTVWGIGARRDSVDSEAFFYQVKKRINRSYRLFGNLEWRPLDSTSINAGLLWENNQVSAPSLSPRLAINQQLSDTHTIRAAFSSAKRQPSLFEEYGDRRVTYDNLLLDRVNDNRFDLDNETVNSIELGYLARFPSTSITVDTRIYRDHIEGFIINTPVAANDRDGTALAPRNTGEFTIDGLELELIYQPSRDFRLTLTNAIMHSQADGFDQISGYTDSRQARRVPDYSGSLFMLKRLNARWDFSLVYSWVGEMAWQNRPVDAYTRLDARLAHRFRIGDNRGEVSLVIQNAGDDYEDYRPRILMETHSYLGIELDF
ncbi:MAG: TonB-dependent receptor, partial [Candidatus Thiodiazotropha sp.]